MDSTKYPSLNEDLVYAECWTTGYGDGSSTQAATIPARGAFDGRIRRGTVVDSSKRPPLTVTEVVSVTPT